MNDTRQTFAGLSHAEIVVWYGLAALSTLVFAAGCALLVRKYMRGRRDSVGEGLLRRAAGAGLSIATHRGIRRRASLSGAAHAGVFYGFTVLFIGTAILGFQDDLTKPLFGWTFWHGTFYLGYSLFLDVFGAALTVGLVILGVRRASQLPRLSYRRVDGVSPSAVRRRYRVGDWVFLGALLFLAASGFLLEALRIAESLPSFETWSPVGWTFAHALRAGGVSGSAASNGHFVVWWLHGLAALCFVAAIPYTKALHMLAAPANLTLHDPETGRRMPTPAPTAPGGEIGYGTVADLRSRHLVGLDACTKCGKCHEACPATATGYPLSPRDLVLDLRELASPSSGALTTNLLGNPIQPDTVWSCMQCNACVEICPVGIEQAPIINRAAAPARRARASSSRRPAADARDDPQVRQLVRREQAQARPLDEGASSFG